MKKLFTLFAFLACFLGAKAEWVEDYSIDYSTHTGFPFYVMGYVPEWFGGVMTDFGAMYKYVQVTDDATETSNVIVTTEGGVDYYKIELSEPGWHQYFIADGIPTEIGQSYTVKAMVKASEACSINVNMGWGWNSGEQASASVSIGTDWQEVEWEYAEINGSSCNLVAQPGTVTATIEWKWVKVSHNQKETRPVEWIELIENGDAEKSWAEMGLADVAYNDMENNYKICAWGKERMVNVNDDGGWDPFPATIEVENGTTNHVFVVHGKEATTEGDASAWDNQFWIQCPQEMKAGTQVKLKFRYKASKNVTVATQTHYQMPSNYLIWHCAGDISFTEEWQTYDQTVTFADDMNGGWSCAFQLNQNDKEAIDFYFDDLSWSVMKLDEGYFVASSNSSTGVAYDFDNAIEFTPEDDVLVATVGTAGKQDTWVNEVMISTVRGYDASFRGATIKPSGTVDGDPDTWLDYTASSNAKIKLPAAGVWTITIAPEDKQINFVKVEGEENKQPIEINPNPYVVVVNGVERDDLSDQTNQQTGEVTVRENEGGTGETWDNQFFIKANRPLDAGEETVISFKYKGSKDAKTTTQCHVLPGDYIHWQAIGDVNFTTEEQTFEMDFTIPAEANSGDRKMQSIAFNMAEIKEACDYTIWDVVWKLKDNTESLIDQTGGANFFVKVGAGTNPEVVDGIENIVVDEAVKSNGAIYNIAGQRVDKSYKGIVIKNGKEYIAK
jgi:hypothetical protein